MPQFVRVTFCYICNLELRCICDGPNLIGQVLCNYLQAMTDSMSEKENLSKPGIMMSVNFCSTDAGRVVLSAITLAPDASPALIPFGESSNIKHS